MMDLLLVALGVLAGMAVEGAVSSYRADWSLWPWPRRHCRSCTPPGSASSWAFRPLVDSPSCPRPHPLWTWRALRAKMMPVAMAALFDTLGQQYAAEPLLLLVSLVESSLLVLLLVIDSELCLVPTPIVGLLVAVALASANLWPGVGLLHALLGGASGFAGFTLLVGLARLLCGAGALGLGDALLALAIGCIVGYPLVATTLALGIVLGGFGAGALLLLRRGGLRQTIPYGPFLIASVLYMLVQGHTMRM